MKLPDIARLTPRLQQQLTRPSAPPEGLRYRGP
ncbi:flagellum-specific ATP synthase domain protein, partial [Yersinia pestis PY-72]